MLRVVELLVDCGHLGVRVTGLVIRLRLLLLLRTGLVCVLHQVLHFEIEYKGLIEIFEFEYLMGIQS